MLKRMFLVALKPSCNASLPCRLVHPPTHRLALLGVVARCPSKLSLRGVVALGLCIALGGPLDFDRLGLPWVATSWSPWPAVPPHTTSSTGWFWLGEGEPLAGFPAGVLLLGPAAAEATWVRASGLRRLQACGKGMEASCSRIRHAWNAQLGPGTCPSHSASCPTI